MRKYLIAIFLSLMVCFSVYGSVYGADQKISELTALGAKPASDDELVIYDSSTGLTKKVDYTYLEDIKNVNLYGGLTAAVASIGATEVTLLITDAQTVTDDLSIPTTMQLFITRGGEITVSAGKVLTINGTILAGAYQIFGTTGTVTFSGSGIAYDNWWSGGSTYTAGDVFFLDADKKFSTLAKGGSLAILRMNSGNTLPEWGTGGQIAFPATAVPSADANTLDDYEEGTWTPVPADANTGGNTGSATAATGRYTKTGDVVVAEVTLSNIDTTGLTAGNDFFIQGLPFAPDGNFSGAVRAQDITFTGYLTFTLSASAIGLRESASGSGGDSVIVSEIADDTGDVYGSIVYKI